MKIGKGDCVTDFRRQRRKKEKKKGCPASGGGRRQAPDTCRLLAGATQLQRGDDTCHLQSRAEPSQTGPADPRLRRGWSACGLRLAHSRARDLALSARVSAWTGRFGSVALCLHNFCLGSSSNTVFM